MVPWDADLPDVSEEFDGEELRALLQLDSAGVEEQSWERWVSGGTEA